MKLVVDRRLGGLPRLTLVNDVREIMYVPQQIRRCVAQLRYESRKGGDRFAGTAFFVRVQETDPERCFDYLVTAGHVIDGIKADSDAKAVHVRLNTQDGGHATIKVHADEWKRHDDHPRDACVDVAVLSWEAAKSADPKLCAATDYGVVPADIFATPDVITDQKIDVGDEVFITGMFINKLGKQKNIPIIRTGIISSMPDEPIRTKNMGDLITYLVEVHSISGLSGSPAFVSANFFKYLAEQEPSVYPNDNSKEYYFLGIMLGHLSYPNTGDDLILEDKYERERVNVGLSMVAPCQKLLEILSQAVFAGERQRVLAELRDDDGVVFDSATGEPAPFNRSDFRDALGRASRPKPEPDGETS